MHSRSQCCVGSVDRALLDIYIEFDIIRLYGALSYAFPSLELGNEGNLYIWVNYVSNSIYIYQYNDIIDYIKIYKK